MEVLALYNMLLFPECVLQEDAKIERRIRDLSASMWATVFEAVFEKWIQNA